MIPDYINIILVFLFFMSYNETDYIDHQPIYCLFPNWDWYVENRWRTKSWWLKNVTTFFLDGGHLNRAIYRIVGFFFFSQLIYQDWRVYALTLALFVLTGTWHSFWNNTLIKWRK